MPRQAKGFTLVEMLIALVLASLILMTLFSALYGGSRLWYRSEVRAEENDATRTGMQLLRRLLAESVPITRNDGRKSVVLFQGGTNVLQWVAPLPSHSGGTGLYWTRLSLRRAALGESELVLSFVPLRPETAPGAAAFGKDAESVVLAAQVEQLEIAYYGKPKDGLPPRWEDRWSARIRVPALVRISLRLRTGSVQWPTLVVPVRVSAHAGQPQWALFAQHNVSG